MGTGVVGGRWGVVSSPEPASELGYLLGGEEERCGLEWGSVGKFLFR